jgi:aspartyl-tRNA(Asn)/glutamyl-tRNA(Gln) amidotransferase subunit C
MKVSKEEIKHIANLARLELNEDEIDNYIENLQDILNFADVVNNAPVQDLDITIGTNEAKNVFRKDEVKIFEDNETLLANAKDKERNMFKIPKVI